MNLSEAQAEIIMMPLDVSIQVLASAGAGKTRVLTERIRHILTAKKKDGVIALTFTNKAAEEMSERLSNVADVEERVWVGTIHSVAQRVLEQYGHTLGLPREFQIYERDQDRMEVFLQSLRDEGIDIDEYLSVDDKRELRGREKILRNYMDGFSIIKRELMDEVSAEEKFPDTPQIWKIFQDYQSALLASGGIDYDDIIVYALQLLTTQEWIADIYRTKYKHLCVDEAQDLNKVQYAFIKALCGDKIRSILMVGDPNQMIYGFNGSSSSYLCDAFIKDFEPVQLSLKENYRSTKSVIRIANKLKAYSQEPTQFALEGIAEVIAFPDEKTEAEWIISTIDYLISIETHPEIEGIISLDNMVVIARNRFVFSKLEEHLKEADIPYTLRKGERGEEPTSLFGRILDYSLRIKLNPRDWVDGKKLCSMLRISPPSIWDGTLHLPEWSSSVANSSLPFANIQADLMRQITDLDEQNPNIRKFVRNLDAKLTSLSEDSIDEDQRLELERSISELREFQSSWTSFKQKGLGHSLRSFRNAAALGQLSHSALASGLTLATVHTMKGLEKDIVFLVGMCEGVFPDYRANSPKEIDEERNTAFVAVTRARRWLYLTYPQQRMMPWGSAKFQQRSRFLDEIEN